MKEKKHAGSGCSWLLTPLQMFQLPSPRTCEGAQGSGLAQEWRKDVETTVVGIISSPNPFPSFLSSSAPSYQLLSTLCTCDVDGITVSQHPPPAHENHHRVPQPRLIFLSLYLTHCSLLPIYDGRASLPIPASRVFL